MKDVTLTLQHLLVLALLTCFTAYGSGLAAYVDSSPLREVRYDLGAVPNDGLVPAGVAITVIFQELPDARTLVTLELIEGATDTTVSHTAHIHFNDVATGGGIAYFLGPIDGLGAAPGKSVFVVEEDFDTLLSFNGYVNVHQSNANLNILISQGNIGANATAEVTGLSLELAADPRSRTYPLGAVSNGGIVSDGTDVHAVFTEFTADSTLVKLQVAGGSTGTNVSHTAHIHFNDVATGGGIAYFLGPIDGLGAAPGVSYAIIEESFDFLVDFDGHINIHQSNANLNILISQGNIGANAILTFSQWLSFKGLSGADAAPDAAPVGDGVPNLLKFALDLDPTQPVRPGDLPFGSRSDTGALSLTYFERVAVDLTYSVEVSTDLVTWHDLDGVEAIREQVRGGHLVTVQENLQGNPQRVFLRLRVGDSSIPSALSIDPLAPTQLNFTAGSNLVSGQVDTPRNTRDFITFTVPEGHELTAIHLLEWEAENDNIGFAHIDTGTTSVIPSQATINDFLGGAHINQGIFGPEDNLLAGLAQALQGGVGFTLPLPAGDYTFNIQQTGPQASKYAVQFVIEEVQAFEPVQLNVVSSGFSAYLIDGQANATLNLVRGRTYEFSVSASGHPFWIKTSPVTGSGSAFNSGVTNNGITSGILTFTVPENAPNRLYYICQFHLSMQGVINITD